jgi:hypothetical protein
MNMNGSTSSRTAICTATKQASGAFWYCFGTMPLAAKTLATRHMCSKRAVSSRLAKLIASVVFAAGTTRI